MLGSRRAQLNVRFGAQVRSRMVPHAPSVRAYKTLINFPRKVYAERSFRRELLSRECLVRDFAARKMLEIGTIARGLAWRHCAKTNGALHMHVFAFHRTFTPRRVTRIGVVERVMRAPIKIFDPRFSHESDRRTRKMWSFAEQATRDISKSRSAPECTSLSAPLILYRPTATRRCHLPRRGSAAIFQTSHPVDDTAAARVALTFHGTRDDDVSSVRYKSQRWVPRIR